MVENMVSRTVQSMLSNNKRGNEIPSLFLYAFTSYSLLKTVLTLT